MPVDGVEVASGSSYRLEGACGRRGGVQRGGSGREERRRLTAPDRAASATTPLSNRSLPQPHERPCLLGASCVNSTSGGDETDAAGVGASGLSFDGPGGVGVLRGLILAALTQEPKTLSTANKR